MGSRAPASNKPPKSRRKEFHTPNPDGDFASTVSRRVFPSAVVLPTIDPVPPKTPEMAVRAHFHHPTRTAQYQDLAKQGQIDRSRASRWTVRGGGFALLPLGCWEA